MPNFCLMPKAIDKFKQGLIDGTVNPEKLAKMSSDERHAFFKNIVGEDAAKGVNASFESKLLLKNQKQGYITWAKNVANLNPAAKRDLLSRVQRLDHVLNPDEEKQFMKDLAATKLGFGVTREESQQIASLAKDIADKESKVKADFTFPSESDRMSYGMAKVNFDNYIAGLKQDATKVGFLSHPLLKTKDTLKATPGFLRSVVSSLDNSFFGRQGIKVLLDTRTSNIWIKSFVKSWGDITKELGGKDAVDIIKADIYSRPNAINGKYKAGGYGLNAIHEDAYPSSAPEKIPLLGRLFKASEGAYNGGALRIRADLADKYIEIAEKQGINTLDKKEAQGLGALVGSMTGRGELGRSAETFNVLLFSARFLKANFDTLTALQFNSKASGFAKKEAAKHLASIVGSMAAILGIAHTLDPKSVELDPRSTHFGKIKVFGHWTDISGGQGALLTLATRLLPITEHNGKFGFYQKTTSGTVTNLTDATYGKQTALDIANNFAEGKFAPLPGTVRDIWAGKNYQGQKPTPGNIASNQEPISIQNYKQLGDAGNADRVGSMILDGLGLSVSNSSSQKANWTNSPTTQTKAFQKKVSPAQFQQANNDYNTKWLAAQGKISTDPRYKALPDAQKTATMTAAKEKIQKEVFNSYGFKYQKQKTDPNITRSKKAIVNNIP